MTRNKQIKVESAVIALNIKSYGSLIQPNDANDIIEISQAKFMALMQAAVELVEIDEAWYAEFYSDVAEGIKSKAISSAREHYIKFGFFEDRLPRNIIVDVDWYLEMNPDVAKGIKNGSVLSAKEHFLSHGFKEGRLPFEGFKLV